MEIEGKRKKRDWLLLGIGVFVYAVLCIQFYLMMSATEGDIMAHEWVSRTIFDETVIGPTQALSYPLYHYVLHGFAWLLQDNYLLAESLLQVWLKPLHSHLFSTEVGLPCRKKTNRVAADINPRPPI